MKTGGLTAFQIISLKMGIVSVKLAHILGKNIMVQFIDYLTEQFCQKYQDDFKEKPSFVLYFEDGTWSISCPTENLERRLFKYRLGVLDYSDFHCNRFKLQLFIPNIETK